MKKISLWAKNNKWQARFLIFGIYLLLNLLGITIGWMLNDMQISISVNAFLFFILLFLAGMFAYPVKSYSKNTGISVYTRQKSCDFILAASTFCMILFIGNKYPHLISNHSAGYTAANASVSFPVDSMKTSYEKMAAFSEKMKAENGKQLSWKEKKKLLKKQVKEIKASGEISPAGKVLLIILSVLVALGLLYVLAALSCSISCGGAEGLAIAVAVLGTGLIIFLLVRLIRSINRKTQKVKPAAGH